MKVLFLTNKDVQYGGVAEVLMHLSTALEELGIEVYVYSSSPSAQTGRMPNGHRCFYGPLAKPGWWVSKKALEPLVHLCQEYSIDLVHCHGVYRAGYIGRLLQQTLRIPYVLTSVGDIMSNVSARMRRYVVRYRCGYILRDAAAVTQYNAFMAQYTNELCNVSEKITIIPNGIDLAWWQKPTAPVTGNYILAIGRLIPAKGFGILLDALRILIERNGNISLVIAGEGEHGPVLKAQAQSLGLPVSTNLEELAHAPKAMVCFPGFVTPETKRDLFWGSQLVAFPSQCNEAESFGIVMIEAMAAGKALVASDILATRSLLTPGQNGELVPPTDAAAWAGAMLRLLQDNTLRHQYEQANLAAAQHYGWPTIAAQYAQVYRQVLGHEPKV